MHDAVSEMARELEPNEFCRSGAHAQDSSMQLECLISWDGNVRQKLEM